VKPDEEVAQSIITELKRLGRLSDGSLERLKPRLSTGSLSAADWKLLFETERPATRETR
jgi:hypothetical protein